MRTITCKHCGTHNGYKSRFCESCGKKIRAASQSDSMFILIVLLAAILAAGYAYYIGYRITDIPRLLSHIK